jgi:hypothetical protein
MRAGTVQTCTEPWDVVGLHRLHSEATRRTRGSTDPATGSGILSARWSQDPVWGRPSKRGDRSLEPQREHSGLYGHVARAGANPGRANQVIPTLDSDRLRAEPGVEPRRRHLTWRTRPIIAAVAAVLFASTLGYLIDNQVSEQGRFDRAQRSLITTRHRTAQVSGDLALLRQEVSVLLAQVASGTTTWNQDTAQLKAAQSALAVVREDVSQQSSLIGALHTCLGGVQQALNALAVNNQATAVSALNSVASSCAAASGV